MHQNNGYTLIEMLFVVSIISILSLFSLTYKEVNISDEIVINDIVQFIHNSKTIAMIKKTTVYIQVKDNQIIRTYNGYKDELLLKNGFFDKEYDFQYNQNGNIKTAKTFSFQTKHHKYDFIMQVGSGTFYVKKKRLNIT